MNDIADYPTRGIQLIVPSNAELAFTGWGVRFARRGHNYEVWFRPCGLSIERDGKAVRKIEELPANVLTLLYKTRETYAATFGGEA